MKDDSLMLARVGQSPESEAIWQEMLKTSATGRENRDRHVMLCGMYADLYADHGCYEMEQSWRHAADLYRR